MPTPLNVSHCHLGNKCCLNVDQMWIFEIFAENVSFEYLIIYMAQKPLENENFKEEPKFSIWGGILTS